MVAAGEVTALCGELYPVTDHFAAAPVCLLERSAVPWFGVRAYGVHINGFVRTPAGIEMWIAKRAQDRALHPGMLDNLVAGGQPAGLTIAANVVKECAEEAAIAESLARSVVPVGAVTYTAETELGLKPDTMFCFDLELPPDFVPRNTDGEVESFERLPIHRVARIVRETREFKPNCNLVVIDFLVRHGYLSAEDPGYLDIVCGLRSGHQDRG